MTGHDVPDIHSEVRSLPYEEPLMGQSGSIRLCDTICANGSQAVTIDDLLELAKRPPLKILQRHILVNKEEGQPINCSLQRSGIAILALVLFLVNSAGAADSAPPLFGGLEPPMPDPEQSLATEIEDWHKDAVVYQPWVAAFRDSDGDGIGDLQGIIGSLKVLGKLGVNASWMLPPEPVAFGCHHWDSVGTRWIVL